MLPTLVLSMLRFSSLPRCFFGSSTSKEAPFRGEVHFALADNVRMTLPRIALSPVSAPNGFTWGVSGPGSDFLSASILFSVLPCSWVVLRAYHGFTATYVAQFAAAWDLDATIVDAFLRDRVEDLVHSLVGLPRISLPTGTITRKGCSWLFTPPSGQASPVSVLEAARLIAES